MAEQAITLASAIVAISTQDDVALHVPSGKQELPVVIRGITTATVHIEGSVDGTNFVSITSKTADAAFTVPAFPYMRSKVTAWTSGTIYVDLFADRKFIGS